MSWPWRTSELLFFKNLIYLRGQLRTGQKIKKKIAWGLRAEAVNSAWKVSGTQDKHLYLMAHLFPTFQIHSSAQAINQDTAKLQFA